MAGVNVIMPAGNDTAFEYLSRILQQWQSNIGFFCVIQPLTEYDFTRAVTSGDFDIAFIKITGEYNSPDAYLSRFGHNARSRPSHLREHLALLEEAGLTTDMQKSAELYAQAEKTLINQAVFVPVCFQTEMFFYNRRSRDLLYNPFTGTIHFREAKYF
jgi:ABC-type oligopeptide transport system substrate-binding subunit